MSTHSRSDDMPARSDETLVVLRSVANEIEAALIVNVLGDYGIAATATGGFISGFKAEAPGDVCVLVKQSELQVARQALEAKGEDLSELPPEASSEACEPETQPGDIPRELLDAWHGAIIGLLVVPFFVNLWSLYSLFKHNLLSQREGPVNWRAPAALGLNVLALMVHTLLLVRLVR
jgi:hypothetical protein